MPCHSALRCSLAHWTGDILGVTPGSAPDVYGQLLPVVGTGGWQQPAAQAFFMPVEGGITLLTGTLSTMLGDRAFNAQATTGSVVSNA